MRCVHMDASVSGDMYGLFEWTRGGQRLTSGAFLCHSVSCFGDILSLTLEFIGLASLSSQQVLPLSPHC